MNAYPLVVQKLIEAIAKLPSIGPRTAERIVLYLLQQPVSELTTLGNLISTLNEGLTRCTKCRNISNTNPCSICSDTQRNQQLLCVVSGHADLRSLEKTNHYHGLYFVLDGCLEPLQNMGPDEIKIPQLLEKLSETKPPFKEIILAFNPDMSGETTALYLKKILSTKPIKLSKLARGLPVGADLEYTDDITLAEALDNRQEIK